MMRSFALAGVAVLWIAVALPTVPVAALEESGSIGIEGRVSAPPPTTGATISIPVSGQTFSELPITVSGICPDNLLVKLFKNNVFSGSVYCQNGAFSIVTDLFSGQNDLVARVFDELDQAGPDSNIVSVNYSDPRRGASSGVTLTSNYAKRGANPGQDLNWPIILSGGTGPYAVSVDWGDGTATDLYSRQFPGSFDMSHVYENPGVYTIIVRASDANKNTAFLQLVGVANGPLSQVDASSEEGGGGEEREIVRVLWQPAAILLPLLVVAFWLGKKHQLTTIKQKITQGERPF